MACQTGIRASEPLRRFFMKCREGSVRVLKVVIKNEELTLNFHDKVTSSQWEDDFRRSLPNCLDMFEPCYVLFRMDSKSGAHGYDWLLITFASDSAATKDKMLLAATRATLKSEFGQTYIRQEYHATTKEDCSLEGYQRWLRTRAAPCPMTAVERGLEEAHLEEIEVQERQQMARSLAAQTARGVAFPIDQEAAQRLTELRDGHINYVQLSVDTLNEAIKLEQYDTVAVSQLGSKIPRDNPRYHFYRYDHDHEGQQYDSIVFLYTLPPMAMSSIKEKMCFSSCKGPFLSTVETILKVPIDRKIEMDCNDKITEEFLLDQLHPNNDHNHMIFSKPKGPQNTRGPRRVIKPVAPT